MAFPAQVDMDSPGLFHPSHPGAFNEDALLHVL